MNVSLRGVVIGVLLMALPAAVHAQAQREDDAFKRGLDARGDKKWPEMATAMREAISSNRTESMRKVQTRSRLLLGRAYEYLPHYFLGEALKMQNNCAGAVNEWEISEDQKVVQGTELYKELRNGYVECAAKGVLLRDEYLKQRALGEQVYNEAVAVLGRTQRTKTGNPEAWRAEFDADLERARTDLTAAQKVLAKAIDSRLPADFSESRNLTTRAGGTLRPLEAKILALMDTRKQIATQVGEAQQLLTSAETTDRNIDAIRVALPQDLAATRESARGAVRNSRDRIGQAEKTQNTATASEAVKLATEANDAFVKVLDQAKRLERADNDQRLQLALTGATEQLTFLSSSFTTLDRLVAEKAQMITPEMSAERDALVKDNGTLLRRFDSAKRNENVPAVQEAIKVALDIRTRLDALIKLFGPASLRDRGVSEPLEVGARLYLSGEYQQAIGALEPLKTMSDVTLQIHAHLFRAASLYALYVRSGEKDQAQRTEALAEVQRCKDLDPAFQPSSKYFSPRFLSFFQTAGAQGSQPTAPVQSP